MFFMALMQALFFVTFTAKKSLQGLKASVKCSSAMTKFSSLKGLPFTWWKMKGLDIFFKLTTLLFLLILKRKVVFIDSCLPGK